MIGREKEVAELLELYENNKAELVAVYGRRRVGKTFLVDETFRNKITFRHAGLLNWFESQGFLLDNFIFHWISSRQRCHRVRQFWKLNSPYRIRKDSHCTFD